MTMEKAQKRLLQRVVPRETASECASPLGVEQLAIPRESCPACDGEGRILIVRDRCPRRVTCRCCKGSGFARNDKLTDRSANNP